MDNYEENISTLRYADQAKWIKCKAVQNESQTDKLIWELKEENDKLKKILQKMGGDQRKEQLAEINANSNLLESMQVKNYDNGMKHVGQSR